MDKENILALIAAIIIFSGIAFGFVKITDFLNELNIAEINANTKYFNTKKALICSNNDSLLHQTTKIVTKEQGWEVIDNVITNKKDYFELKYCQKLNENTPSLGE